MKLVLPLVAMFVIVGLTRTSVNRRTYAGMFAVILIVAVMYLMTWTPE